MKVHILPSIKRSAAIAGTTASFVVLTLFGFGVIPSLMARASAAPAPCPSGSFTITNHSASNLAIAGDGVNNPVFLEATGNCFHTLNKFTWSGHTGYEYQNGDGHCLWNDGGTIELGAACKAGHTNEEFFGFDYVSGGWVMGNVTDGSNDIMNAPDCAVGSEVTMGPTGICQLWNF
jgi:hypothetical protein